MVKKGGYLKDFSQSFSWPWDFSSEADVDTNGMTEETGQIMI